MPRVVSLLAVSLTVSVVMKVIDAQLGCEVSKLKCTTDYTKATSSIFIAKDKSCKAANDYLACLETAAKDCGGDADTIVEPAKNALSLRGCSRSGAPVLSLLTIVFGVVISRYF
ncbi:uncharacterized protein LOC134279602 [Saccostrea cucullata]|uniref:uncharacterized protein LOC134279602 n=1 Tax=Saccostrea cuccullata TaxID=36930 RepID=UPI002ED024FA